MGSESTVQRLLQGTEFNDPRMFDLLNLLITDVYDLYNQVNPPTDIRFGFTGQIPITGLVTGFQATLFPYNVRLTWEPVSGISQYIIKYISGAHDETAWDDANTILTTSTLSADINPLTIPLTTGNHTFLIKAVNNTGVGSSIASFTGVNVPQILPPVVTASVISNSVLLYWTTPVSVFAIAHYNVFKNGNLVGNVNGTFDAVFETTGGIFTYSVQAVDIVGNLGVPSAGVTVQVQDPADYALHSTLVSSLNGTRVNVTKTRVGTTDYLLAPTNDTETYDEHFNVNNHFASPQAQIDAGFPYYIEPSKLTGTYTEVFDFTATFDNTIVVVQFNTITGIGTVTTNTSTIETSFDGITWSAPVVAASTFAASLRYVRVTIKFVAVDTKSLMYLYNLQCILNVKREQDGGTALVYAADAGGTVVPFNKVFKHIDTIDLTAVSTVEQKAVYDFAFPVNPTTFKILLFNAAGARINGKVTWISRGIV
jgi:hypothetical protein